MTYMVIIYFYRFTTSNRDVFRGHLCERRKCTECEKTFKHVTTYNDHIKSHEKKSNVTCTCAECGKAYQHKTSLRRHMLDHVKTDHCLCDKCGKLYKEFSSLRTHQLKLHWAVWCKVHPFCNTVLIQAYLIDSNKINIFSYCMCVCFFSDTTISCSPL